tara:strand:- start:15800 stop:16231 length:432 start_codon:yes stop_codon:yes gene_type:complete
MQMDHNSENKTLQITLKTFVDDLEKSLKTFSGEKVFLNEIQGSEASHKLIQKYVQQAVGYKVNNKAISFTWIGWEIDKDEVFIYYEIPLPRKVKSIEVKNEMMMKLYLDQVNVVHLKYGGKNRSFVLEGLETGKTFNLVEQKD